MRSKRERLEMNDNMMTIVHKMSEGNPGAVSVMSLIIARDQTTAFMTLLDLDDMNIRGSQIWIGYKDHCHEDLNKFTELVNARDQALVSCINKESAREGITERCVTHGASFK